MLRIPYCVDGRLIDGGEISLTRQPPSTLQKHFLVIISKYQRLSQPQGHNVAERIRLIKKIK
jgi:hypothetical protein